MTNLSSDLMRRTMPFRDELFDAVMNITEENARDRDAAITQAASDIFRVMPAEDVYALMVAHEVAWVKRNVSLREARDHEARAQQLGVIS